MLECTVGWYTCCMYYTIITLCGYVQQGYAFGYVGLCMYMWSKQTGCLQFYHLKISCYCNLLIASYQKRGLLCHVVSSGKEHSRMREGFLENCTMVSHAFFTRNVVMQCLRMQEHQHAAVRLCCTAVQTYNITIGTAWQSVLTELGAQGMCSVELELSYMLIAAIIVYAKQCTYYGQDQVLHCFALLWNNYNAMCVHNLPLLELHNFLFWVLEQ